MWLPYLFGSIFPTADPSPYKIGARSPLLPPRTAPHRFFVWMETKKISGMVERGRSASVGSLERENPSSIDPKIVLIKGKESAIKLKSLLQESTPSEDQEKNSMIGFLIEEILGSFDGAVAALESGGAPEAPLDQASTPCSDEQGTDNSSKKRKVPSDRKNGYRRR